MTNWCKMSTHTVDISWPCHFHPFILTLSLLAHTHTHTHKAGALCCPRCAGGGRAGSCRAAPGAIWQRLSHLHNVIFYLISPSKCNQKLMRAPSCLADWQHDIALTPNTATLHPNDPILKTMAATHNNNSYLCVCVCLR